MGVTNEDAYSSVRFSLGKYTTEAEIDLTIELISQAVKELRSSL
jgi:cysteine desulfurase